MARVTVPLFRLSTNDDPSFTAPQLTTAAAWSSRVFAINNATAETYLLERHHQHQHATHQLPQPRANAHFNHQLFPSCAGPFDLLLRIDPTTPVASPAAPTAATTTSSSAATATARPTTAAAVPSVPSSSSSRLPLKLTCRVGTTCLHFSLDQHHAEVTSLGKDTGTGATNAMEAFECHLSRSTVTHLRRLAARWCPVVSYCTAAALAHPGWTEDVHLAPTKVRPVVVCPCATGVQLKWIEWHPTPKTKTSSKKRKGIDSTGGANSAKSKYAVPVPVPSSSVHATTFVFDVEKYCIRIVREDHEGILQGLRNHGKSNGVSLFRRVLAACSGGRGGGGGGGNGVPFYALPMTMDESRAHPLVPMFDSLLW